MPPIAKKYAPEPAVVNGSKERLSLNLFDLDRTDQLMRQLLLGGKLDLTQAIWVDKSRMDETAVAFTCDLLTAACICDTLRGHDRRAGDYPTRVYLQKAVAWNRLPNDMMLALVEDGKVVLNPRVFTIELERAPSVAPVAVALAMGRKKS